MFLQRSSYFLQSFIIAIKDFQSFISSLFYPCLSLQIVRGVFSILYFGGQSTKAPAHGKISRLVLCSQVALGQHSSVERALPLKPIVSFSGVAELTRLSTLCAYNQRSNSPHAISEKQPGSHCAL